MKVGLYLGKNKGARAFNVRAAELAKLWPDTVTASSVAELKGCDVVYNQVLADIPKLEEQRRYVGFGPQAGYFGANILEFSRIDMLKQMLELLRAPLICPTKRQYQRVLQLLEAFSPGLRREMQRNVVHLPMGIRCHQFTPGANDKNRWVVPYNRCNFIQKRMNMHSDLTGKLLALAAKQGAVPTVEMYVHAMEEVQGKDAVLSNYTVALCPPTQAEYLAYAQGCGMFLSTSVEEVIGNMYLELLLSGCVGVFVDEPWVHDLLPGYPFIASKKDVVGMFMAVYRDYDKARKYVLEKTAPFIREQYDYQRFADSLYGYLQSLTTQKG